LEFVVQIKEDEKPRGVRIIVPIKCITDDEKKRTQELNIIHRTLFYHLKAKFIAVQSGLTEFEEEFMAHLIVTDKNGNSTTIGETMLPHYKQYIEDGPIHDFAYLPSPKEEK